MRAKDVSGIRSAGQSQFGVHVACGAEMGAVAANAVS